MKHCGVKIVIDTIFSALSTSDFKLHMIYSSAKKKYSMKGVTVHDVPEVDYSDTTYDSRDEFEKAVLHLAEKLQTVIDVSKPCIIHCHNANLLKNPCVAPALKHIAIESPHVSVIFQVHDFAEEGRDALLHRMHNLTGSFDAVYGARVAYPTGKNIVYCSINIRDKELLEKMGLPVFLLHNNIDCDSLMQTAVTEGLTERLQKYAQREGYRYDPSRRVILSPLKIMRRKNVVETLFLLQQLNYYKDEWQLLITLDAHSSDDAVYASRLKDFIKEHNLPVVIGFGFDFISPNFERTSEYPFTLVDLFEISDFIVTTSIKEGFGMTYLEGWVVKKPVIGRRLNYIFPDFEQAGLSMDHFYSTLRIKGKDFINYSEDEQYRLIEKDCSAEEDVSLFLRSVYSFNEAITAQNHAAFLNHFSLDAYRKRLHEIITKASSHEFTEINVDNTKVIDYFKQ
ncbi:MAG: hypothetical protein ACMXYE_00720 [Candidatus Woesearchaeota archaeon]